MDAPTILVVKFVPSSNKEVFIYDLSQPAPTLQTRISCVKFTSDRGSRIIALIAESLNGSYGSSIHLRRLSSGEPGV